MTAVSLIAHVRCRSWAPTITGRCYPIYGQSTVVLMHWSRGGVTRCFSTNGQVLVSSFVCPHSGDKFKFCVRVASVVLLSLAFTARRWFRLVQGHLDRLWWFGVRRSDGVGTTREKYTIFGKTLKSLGTDGEYTPKHIADLPA